MVLMLIYICCLLFHSVVNQQLDVGDDCTLPNNKSGICMRLDSCPAALRQIQIKEHPSTCAYEGLKPIVCCEPLELRSADKYCKEFRNLLPPTFVVSGGEDALEKEFPHMVALGFGKLETVQWQCGGSLISEQYVLTAAHCLYSRDFGNVTYARLGGIKIRDSEDDEQIDVEIIERIPHPAYKKQFVYDDIALVKLKEPLTFTEYIQPACLNSKNLTFPDVYIATGWGTLEYGGEVADHLQKVNLTAVSTEECARIYNSSRRIPDGIRHAAQFCVGGFGKDTCQGDSGGPLQKRQYFHLPYTIYGVTSFGKACGIGKSIGVYSNVKHYLDWIESVVWPR